MAVDSPDDKQDLEHLFQLYFKNEQWQNAIFYAVIKTCDKVPDLPDKIPLLHIIKQQHLQLQQQQQQQQKHEIEQQPVNSQQQQQQQNHMQKEPQPESSQHQEQQKQQEKQQHREQQKQQHKQQLENGKNGLKIEQPEPEQQHQQTNSKQNHEMNNNINNTNCKSESSNNIVRRVSISLRKYSNGFSRIKQIIEAYKYENNTVTLDVSNLSNMLHYVLQNNLIVTKTERTRRNAICESSELDRDIILLILKKYRLEETLIQYSLE